MKVLFVYPFCGLGGVETSVINKVRMLDAHGVVSSALFSARYGIGDHAMEHNPRITVTNDRRRRRQILEMGYDRIVVIDFPDFFDELDEFQIRSRVLFETHASYPPALRRYYSRLDHPSIQGIVVPAEFNKRCIQKLSATTRPIHVVPNPIDTELFYRRPAREIVEVWGEPGGPVIVWIGRLEDEKNPVDFVKAAGAILAARSDVRAIVVGDADDYPAQISKLSELVTVDLRSRIRFVRSLPYAAMPTLYSLAADTGGCLVSTSRYESYPMTFIEAMACGCPVVTSEVGGVSEAVVDGVTGLTYPLEDLNAAAEQVLAFINGTVGRQELVARALGFIQTKHSGAKFVETYTRLLSAPPTPLRRRPLVSCIIIFLNGEAFIEEAIASVFAQTYDNWELILVDDGSTDASTEIARSYVRSHPDRVRYVDHPNHVNRGKSASRNLGLRTGRGDLFAFLDCDDVWAPHKLEQQLAILDDNPDAAMMFGRTLRWFSWSLEEGSDRDYLTQSGVTSDRLIAAPMLMRVMLIDQDAIPATCSALIRRSAVDEIGGFEEEFRDSYEDVVFMSKVFLHGPVFTSSGCWDRYRQHPAMSCAVAMRSHQWHHANLNPSRRKYLVWLNRYLTGPGVADPEILSAVRRELRRYRHTTLSGILSRARGQVRFRWHALRVALARWRNKSATNGQIGASPKRIRILQPASVGTTTLSWSSTGTSAVEVRMDAPDGPFVIRTGPSGHVVVTLWAGDRTPFYLQDVSDQRSLTAANTLAVIRVTVDNVAVKSTHGDEACALVTAHDGPGGTTILERGKALIMDRGTLAGSIEQVIGEPNGLRVIGWAADLAEGRSPCRLLMFIKDRLVHIGSPGAERIDLSQRFRCSSLGKAGFNSLLPVDYSADAASTIRVFAVSNGRAFELPRSASFPSYDRYRLSRESDCSVGALEDAHGNRLPLMQGAVQGHLDVIRMDAGRGLFKGWAIDTAASEIAASVAVFADGRFLCARQPNVERPDVARALGNEAFRWAGFDFNVPIEPTLLPVSEVCAVGISRTGRGSILIPPQPVVPDREAPR